jgi:hypothetical protein
LTGYLLHKNNFLYALADETVQQLLAGGILQYEIEMSFVEYLSSFVNYEGPYEEQQPTTYEDLSYGFTLSMFSCLICCIVFLLELIAHYIKMNPIYHFRNLVRALFAHVRN